MGEVPDRAIFSNVEMAVALKPYLDLTQAVRIGNLQAFSLSESKSRDTFLKDDTLKLIHRLRQNVIKTGLRKISISYSRISFADIAEKLKLESVDETEFA